MNPQQTKLLVLIAFAVVLGMIAFFTVSRELFLVYLFVASLFVVNRAIG